MNIDPATVKPTAGKLLVEIVEVLGGTLKSGLFVPPSAQDHMGKDTFYGRVMVVGPPPSLEHYRDELARGGFDVRPPESGAVWAQEVMAQFNEGDIMICPRDVPLGFTFEERRYALVLMHEGLFVISPEDFDASDFEVVAWTPPEIP